MAEQREKLLSKPSRSFDVGEKVHYRDVNHNQWVEGVVKSLEGSKIVVIEADGGLVRKHLDHVVVRRVGNESQVTQPVVEHQHNSKPDKLIEQRPDSTVNAPVDRSLGQTDNKIVEQEPIKPSEFDGIIVPEPRPRRSVNAPDRLNYEKLGGK